MNIKYCTFPRHKIGNLLDPAECLNSSIDCDEIVTKFSELVNCSLSKATWSKYNSGWNSFKNFLDEVKIVCEWPVSIETIRTYIVWAITVKGLKPSTVRTYLQGLRIAHILTNKNFICFSKDSLSSMLLTGAENSCPNNFTNFSRKSMTIDSLLIFGHCISQLSWSEISKQVVWTAACIAFFSSARMGEILPNNRSNWDPFTTLIWKYVDFGKEDIVIFLPSTKTSKTKGEIIDLFLCKNEIWCPVQALKKLFRLKLNSGNFNENDPIFTFENNLALTPSIMNNLLKEIFSNIFNEDFIIFSNHSFRAAIPGLIANYPDKSFTKDIMEWGRWKGNSYELYTRTVACKRKSLFEKILMIIKNS